MQKPNFEIVYDRYNVIIQDTRNGLNFAFLAHGMMGVSSTTEQLGKKVCDFLNNLPAQETYLMKHLPLKEKEPSKTSPC